MTAISRPGLAAGIRMEGFAPLDVLTATYTACSATVLLVRSVVGEGVSPLELRWLLVAHALLLVLVVLARRARLAAAPGYSVLAEWYPVLILTAIYASIGLVNAPREALGLSGDPLVLHWESRLAGPQYLDRWAGHAGPPIVNWGLALSYLAFFPMVIAAPMVLWLQGQRARAQRAIFGITLTFLACYLVFLLFPVAGPAYVRGWPETQAGSDLPIRLVRSLNDQGDSWGSAFPSSHVAASAAALMLGMNGCRRLGTALLPIAVGILLAVVYFRVHYVLDAVAGLALATLIVTTLYRLWPLRADPT
ncbi:MAG TPA: phosphatase PAP2 family protein [Gemmatimonadales bacterium]|nr:phosphatase PAP2 family protein [Gemmatimonadales bacterium]